MTETIVEEMLEFYDLADDAWGEQRDCMREDIKFSRLSEQWDERVKEQREQEARPCLTVNKCPQFARQVVNNGRQFKPSIRIHPADDQADEETAEIMNGLIRNIEYTSDAEVAYDTALENAVYGGIGYFRIDVDYSSYDQFDMDILINRVPDPLTVYPDIHTQAYDSSDWNECLIENTLAKDVFEQKYPDADLAPLSSTNYGEWLSDEEVKVGEYWKRKEVDTELLRLSDGTILLADQYKKHQNVFYEAGLVVIEQRPTKTFKVTQYVNSAREKLDEIEWAGRYIPVIPVYGEEFTFEGKRYFKSMFRDARDAQRMFNYWRTASTELVALAPKAPFVGVKGQFVSDAQNWATANVESHPYLEADPVTDEAGNSYPPPQRQPFAGVPAGAVQEAASAMDDMKAILGMEDPSIEGMADVEMSGRAIQRQQRTSDISNFHFVDNLSRSMRHAGRVLLDLIPKVYSQPRVMRTMGLDGSVNTVPINQEYDDGGMVKIHDMSKGKYDLTVDTGPSYNTKREEAVASLTRIVEAQPELMGVVGDLIAKNMDWEGADEMAKRLKAMLPPQIQALEEMNNIPEEARVFIANAQGQVEQLQQTIEQAKQEIAARDQQIQDMARRLDDKSTEHQLENKKIEAGLIETRMKEMGDQQLEVLKSELESRHKQQMQYLEQSGKAQLELLQAQLKELTPQ